MSTSRRSGRTRTTRQSYVEVPEEDEDIFGEELPGSEPTRAPKRRRRVVLDTDDESDDGTFPPSTSSANAARGVKQAEASASKPAAPAATKQTTLMGFARAAVPQGEKPKGNNGLAQGKQAVAPATPRQTTLQGFARVLPPQGNMPRGDNNVKVKQAVASASKPAAPKRAAGASTRQTTLQGFTRAEIPQGEMPRGDSDDVGADIPEPRASEVGFDEDSDEDDDDFIPGPDPNIVDEIDDEIDISDVVTELDVTDAEIDDEFARKLRIVLDLLCGWAKSINYMDFRGLSPEDRPVSYSTYHVLAKVSVELLVGMCLPSIPLQVQELFSKREWHLEDVLSLPRVEANDHDDQGLYANFPTGDLQHVTKIGCECYVGSTAKMLKRINQHLDISRRFSVRTLPEPNSRSFHYRTTCRENVVCNFRKLAVFKRRIPAGYLTIMESVFMVLFGTYNYPGYCSKWATKSSYNLVEEIRGQLELAPIVWKGLNAALPLRQGCRSRNCKTPSPCSNPACETMTYPRSMMPDGVKYNRCLANPSDPLGGYWCDRCERHLKRHGVLPNKAKLEKLASEYAIETAKSELRATGQAVVCSNCGAVEGEEGAANSFMGNKIRFIASNGKIRCMACDTYVRLNGKERDVSLQIARAIREQADADRAAGRPIHCKYCNKVEPAGVIPKKRWVASKQGGMVCRYCYDKKGRR